MVTRLDPVASRLASAENVEPTLVLDWLEGRQQRNALHRRTFWCSLGVGRRSRRPPSLAVRSRSSSATTPVRRSPTSPSGAAVGTMITKSSTRQSRSRSFRRLLALVAAILLIGGLVAWCLGRFPGHSRTSSAIDWSNVSDAVWRLLSVGCTYPESFETGRQVSRCGSNRLWLRQSAEQVQRGASEFPSGKASNGDVAMLQTLVQTSDAQPSARWRLGNNTFW